MNKFVKYGRNNGNAKYYVNGCIDKQNDLWSNIACENRINPATCGRCDSCLNCNKFNKLIWEKDHSIIPNILINQKDMFDFIQYSRQELWNVSFNPLFPHTYFRGGINGGIERITFKELWEEFNNL